MSKIVTLEIADNGDVRIVDNKVVSSSSVKRDAPQEQDFPLYIPEYNHRFNSLAELQDYEARLAEREKNLTSTTHTSVDITPVSNGSTMTLPLTVSKAFSISNESVIALAVDIPEGTTKFRVGAGEYKSSPAHFGLALSRTPLEIEGAPLRGVNSINADVSSEGLLSPGKWFINVRKEGGGREGDTSTSFIISAYAS